MRYLLEVEHEDNMLVGLFHAIGKFVRYFRDKTMETLVVYLVHHQFSEGPNSTHVAQALLSLLANEIPRNEKNSLFIGTIFKPFVQNLIRCKDPHLQRLAVQFISKWLPMTNQDGGVIGMDALIAGLDIAKQYYDMDKQFYNRQLQKYQNQKMNHEHRLALRARLTHQLLQIPGTWANLGPVPGQPGYFADLDSGMMSTRGIIAKLPVDPESAVTISRPIPQIPGVPSNMTTVPPVFMPEESWNNLSQPRTEYEALEMQGRVPGLPGGFTYAPSPLVELAFEEKENAGEAVEPEAKKGLQSRRTSSRPESGRQVKTRGPSRRPSILNPSMVLDVRSTPRKSVFIGSAESENEKMPDGATVKVPLDPPKRKFPPGFSGITPFPGFDFDKIDRNVLSGKYSAIYTTQSNGINSVKSSRFSSDKHPVLYPNFDNDLYFLCPLTTQSICLVRVTRFCATCPSRIRYSST